MEKMIRKALFCALIIPCLSVCSISADNSDGAAVVIAHGFGGYGGKDRKYAKKMSHAFGVFCDDSRHAPSFPDAGGYFSRTVLYTRPAVLVLTQQLLDIVQSGKNAIHLVAHSCGGGVVINMMAHLIHYEKNKDYFADTGITLEHATAIVEALKKGSINITAPLLSAERSKGIIWLGGVLSASTCAIGAASLYYAAADRVKEFFAPHVAIYVKNNFQQTATLGVTNLGFVGLGWSAYRGLGQKLKRFYIKYGVRYIMPLVSRYNFDPYHPTPLDLIDMLEDKLITRLHISANDEMVDISPEDIEKLRLKAAEVQIVDGTDHTTICNSLHDVISRSYCQKYE